MWPLKTSKIPHPTQIRRAVKPSHLSESGGLGWHGASLNWSSSEVTPSSCHFNYQFGLHMRKEQAWVAKLRSTKPSIVCNIKEIVCKVQARWAGLGWGGHARFWFMAKHRNKEMVAEVMRTESVTSMPCHGFQQRSWKSWEGNLHHWFGSEERCPLCNIPDASLQHILPG